MTKGNMTVHNSCKMPAGIADYIKSSSLTSFVKKITLLKKLTCIFGRHLTCKSKNGQKFTGSVQFHTTDLFTVDR